VGSTECVSSNSLGIRMANDGSRVVEVVSGEWICEAALWLQWRHAGLAVGKTDCDLVALCTENVQSTMHAKLPEAQRYARLLLAYTKAREDVIGDAYADLNCLRAMAREAFEPPQYFNGKQCWPARAEAPGGRNEWQLVDRRQWQLLWSSPWKEGHAFNRSALLSTMIKVMRCDAVLLFHTLHGQNSRGRAWDVLQEVLGSHLITSELGSKANLTDASRHQLMKQGWKTASSRRWSTFSSLRRML